MANKKTAKTDVAIINNPEFKKLVDDSLKEMDMLYGIIASDENTTNLIAKEELQKIYLRNLKFADEPVAVAKKLLAEGLTRMELAKLTTPQTELLGKDFKQNVKLTSDLLRLVKDMEPKVVKHQVAVDDDKMVFPIIDGVYNER